LTEGRDSGEARREATSARKGLPVSPALKLVLLGLAWLAWCALHSGLATERVAARVRRRWGRWSVCWRLCYNAVSLATLVLVVYFESVLRTRPLLPWVGPLRGVQILLWASSALLLVLGAQAYDLWEFLGFRQIANAHSAPEDQEPRELVTSGVLGVVRHPWYLAAILLLWSHDQDAASLVRNAILTPYIVFGAAWEEDRLLAEFGDRYQEYRERVPVLFPTQWLRAGRRRRAGGG